MTAITAKQIRDRKPGRGWCVSVFVAEEERVTDSGELVAIMGYVVLEPGDYNYALEQAMSLALWSKEQGRTAWIQETALF